MNNKYKIMSCAIRYIKMLRKLWVQYLESFAYEQSDYSGNFQYYDLDYKYTFDEFCKFKVEYIIIDLYAYRT